MKWRGRVKKAVAMGDPGYLSGFKVAVDVQHLYRPNHPKDHGSVYTSHLYPLPGGGVITETHCTTIYAGALHDWLIAWGAEVLTNDPIRGTLIGLYSERNRVASLWGADLYLACHLNAGGGTYAAVEMMAWKKDDRLSGFVVDELTHSIPEIPSGHGVTLSPGERGAICIENCSCLAAIVEPFFGDTTSQQALFPSARLVEVGQAVARGVGNWWRGSHVA